jgi:hypothetical protein
MVPFERTVGPWPDLRSAGYEPAGMYQAPIRVWLPHLAKMSGISRPSLSLPNRIQSTEESRLIAKAGREFSAATIYMSDPSSLYDVGPMVESDAKVIGNFPSLGCRQAQVLPTRALESEMLRSIATYAHGRLGAEIAYALSVKILGLDDMVLVEPSIGGKELYTSDKRILVKARLLTKPGPLKPGRIRRTLRIQLCRLIRKLKEGFAYNPDAIAGYATLSYMNSRSCSVTTTACEIRNHQLGTGYGMQAAL